MSFSLSLFFDSSHPYVTVSTTDGRTLGRTSVHQCQGEQPPLTVHLPPPGPKLSPSPSGHQVAPPDRAGPALPGPAGGAPAARRLGREGGFRSVCLPPVPSHGLPYEGESQAPVIRCGPLRRDASDFSPRTPGKATRGCLGRLSRISEITAQVRA